jgi:hypothetical protein
MAKVIESIVVKDTKLPNIIHIVPKDSVNKEQLLKLFAKYFKRQDLKINPIRKGKIDLRLSTMYRELNKKNWENAGYSKTPTIEQIVQELALNKF